MTCPLSIFSALYDLNDDPPRVPDQCTQILSDPIYFDIIILFFTYTYCFKVIRQSLTTVFYSAMFLPVTDKIFHPLCQCCGD